MKKKLLYLIVLLLPMLGMSQSEPAVYKDFGNNIRQYTCSFPFDEHLAISQINTDNENFDLVAINDHMETRWKVSLSGYAMKAARVADKIIAVAVTDYTFFKGKGSCYKGYIIDPADGKVLTEKILYEGSAEYMEFPALLTGSGASFKLGIRQSAVKRKVHTPLPGPLALFSLNSYGKQYQETKSLTVLDFNDRLEIVGSLKPVIYNGPLIGMEAGAQGDVFVAWLKEGHITVDHYNLGKQAAPVQLTSGLELSENNGFLFDSDILFFPSATSKSMLYYSLMYVNAEKDHELVVGKMDFTSGKAILVKEAFSKDHVKSLEKAFIPVNTKMNKADIGGPRGLDVRYLAEANGKVVVTVSAKELQVGARTSWIEERSILINGYDTDLGLRFQQFLPAQYIYIGGSIPTGYHTSGNKFYSIANDKRGMATLNGLYGVLDLNSGKWDKMEWLSKRKIGGFDYADAPDAFWFVDSFVLPYCGKKGIMGDKRDITLQQNSY
ncbi:MAG: hypothetical protein EOO61_04545 [Hymenobacter sp.]|nr:MAG: hypothetical protein EOO61_04545 [Hymenobacter sp.]